MKSILAYRFSAFGDVAMLAPVLREFLEQNPDTEITMVSRENFQDLFADIKNLHFTGVNVENYKGIFGIKKFASELLKNKKFDYIADFHDVIRTKILDNIFEHHGYKVFKINKEKDKKKTLTDVWNLNKVQLKPTTERYADVLREMGFSVTLSHQLRKNNLPKSGIGIAPFAQHKGKMLPLEKTWEVAKILSKKNKIYFFGGGPKEAAILEKWEKQIPNSTSFAGKIALSKELKKISELQVMISMDSANMHLASLMGTRCISIWGATHPFAGFLGYGQSETDVVQIKDLTCRPCSVFGDKECFRGDWACLEEIDVQKVISKI